MKEAIIKSVSELTTALPGRENLIFKTVFRGHGNIKWSLIPSFYRMKIEVFDNSKEDVIPNYGYLEQRMLKEFQNRGASLLRDYAISSQLDLMIVAQNHGLPTRLLDWTENPLYALFFAVEQSDINEDACVYSYTSTVFTEYKQIASDESFYSDTKYFFVEPLHLSERVRAQGSCYVLHPLYRTLNIESFETLQKLYEQEERLVRLRIPKERKREIRRQLDHLNINRFTIYPDLDGLTHKLRWDFENIPIVPKGLKLIHKKSDV